MTAQLSIDFSTTPRMPREKRLTQKERIKRMFLAAHERGEYLTNLDFLHATPWLPNFSSRFQEVNAELKELGLKIGEAEFVKTGVWRYRLVKP